MQKIIFSFFILFLFDSTPNDKDVYTNKGVFITIDDFKLFGILSTPKVKSQLPLAIIIGGSGPVDRDGNTPTMTNNSLKMLSEELLKKNIATFRFDKRGVRKSQIANLKEQDLIFDDFVNDVKKWITHFKSNSSFSEIFLIGHSEGSLIGLLAAQEIDVSGVISLAGTAYSADVIIKQQLKNNLSAPYLQEGISIVNSLSKQEKVVNIPEYFNALFRESVQPYLISWFQYKPMTEIQKLDVPMLIIHGTDDLQVPHTDANFLAQNSNNAKKVIIDGMNHILKYTGGDLTKNHQAYNDAFLSVSSKLIKEIAYFINKQ